MTLERGVYRALEDIVGQDNISEEPAVLDSYSVYYGVLGMTGSLFMPRSEAVVLPESAEQVQSIVRTCNKYKIKFKALSVGWGLFNSPKSAGMMIQIDLRRMNKIIEINERQMYAVVEPYVTCAQLQAELMKLGLNCNIISAGSNTSAMGSFKLVGWGQTGVSTSTDSRNILGVEWVMPSGDILRLGSLGSGAGWFCGDGPGPSLRGILRGFLAPAGGLGIHTKAATKIYDWPGPPVMPVSGISPNYVARLPDTFKLYYPVFPTWEKFADATYKIAESEIPFLLSRITPFQIGFSLTTSNEEGVKYFAQVKEKIKGKGFAVILATRSQREFEYQEKVLRQIVAEEDGEFSPLVDDPEIQGKLMWQLIRHSTRNRMEFRPTGAFTGVMGNMETWDHCVMQARTAEKIKQKYIDQGWIFDDGADNAVGEPLEYGRYGRLEELVIGHGSDPVLMRKLYRVGKYLNDACIIEKHAGTPMTIYGDEIQDQFGPVLGNYHIWLRKLKKALDPDLLSESGWYITPKE